MTGKRRKLAYLLILLEEASSVEYYHILANLYLAPIIRKYQLKRLVDGAITGVSTFLLLDILEPEVRHFPLVLMSMLLACYVIISGGFYFRSASRSRSDSAK